jgi:hypothetical protein
LKHLVYSKEREGEGKELKFLLSNDQHQTNQIQGEGTDEAKTLCRAEVDQIQA